jgi:hypothetical protein
LQHANILLIDGEDVIFRLFAFFLVFVPPWHQLRTLQPLLPAWPLRLFQLELCLIYACAATQKTNGPEWLEGTALYFPLRLDDFSRFALPAPISESFVGTAIVTWAVVLFEFLVPVLIWWPKTRRWCLLGAFVFHAATDYAMNLHLFHWIMLVGFLSFVRYEEWLAVRLWLTLPVRFLSGAARHPVKAEVSHRTTRV